MLQFLHTRRLNFSFSFLGSRTEDPSIIINHSFLKMSSSFNKVATKVSANHFPLIFYKHIILLFVVK
jgi:hypothetical protein